MRTKFAKTLIGERSLRLAGILVSMFLVGPLELSTHGSLKSALAQDIVILKSADIAAYKKAITAFKANLVCFRGIAVAFGIVSLRMILVANSAAWSPTSSYLT